MYLKISALCLLTDRISLWQNYILHFFNASSNFIEIHVDMLLSNILSVLDIKNLQD